MSRAAGGAASGNVRSAGGAASAMGRTGSQTGGQPALDPLHAGRATPPRRFRSLASRLVALGLGQLVLLALTAVGIFFAEGPHEEADPEQKLTAGKIAQLEQLIDSPTALGQALDELRVQRVEISLYDGTRQLIASNVDPPLAIPPRPPRRGHRPPGDGPPDDRGDRRLGPPGAGDPPPPDDHPPGPPPDDRAPSDRPPGAGDQPASGDRATGSGDHSQASSDRPAGHPAATSDRRPDSGGHSQSNSDQSTGDRAPGPPPDDRGFGGPGGPGGPPGPDFDTAMRSRWIAARHRLILPLHVHGARGVLVARGVHGEPPGLTGPLLVLVGGFLILVIGALITARWIVRPIERLSRTVRALGAGDLQARSRLDRDDEIGQLGHRFDEMAERISSLLITEKELLANVAHELRTPLTRIGVALDLANEGDAEAARASIVEIAVDVSELETIVDDILTAMRFEIAPGKEAAQLPLRRAVLPAAEIALAAADRQRVRHTNRTLELEIADDLPMIHVDPVLFRRVIDNLLENAHKYTPDIDSPITLAVTRASGDAPTGDAPAGVTFEIRDHGVGISTEDLPRIFTAFFRSERSRSRETGGVGLGLTLARRIVEAHGGTIDVSSTIHVGTSIRVTIPAQR